MKAYTSRARFDEARNFTGVFQQMGRVSLDADWNEEVLIRTTDARRRTSDLAHGSPDDGYLISDEHLVDRITGVAGWTGSGLEAGDLRVIPAELELDRREPEGLPYVIRSHGHVEVTRELPAALDLTALALDPSGDFAAHELIFSVRFERPANDDELVDVAFFVVDEDGNRATVTAGFGQELPGAWTSRRVALAAFAGIDPSRVTRWGVEGLPPRAQTWIDSLRATDDGLGRGDFVIRGGDGTVVGAGRMLVDGLRAYLRRDVRYSRQPDLPDPPPLPELASNGSDAHVVYLDAWEQVVTSLDDDFLEEPALDGLDTTVRLRLLTQIKAQPRRPAGEVPALPAAIGGGRLTTNVGAGSFPDRYPPDPEDPCRDRCLFTENASVGEGYTGAHNLHVRVEIISTDGPLPVVGWSRDNGSTRLPLLADAPADTTTLMVSGADAQRLRAGDIVVISDRRIDRQPDGSRRPVLRVVKSSDPATGTVMLREGGFELASDPASLVVGGPLGESFAVTDRAYLRRWDGADWLLPGVRYNLPDGITFRFSGTGVRAGEYWSFTARIESSDGAARGVVEQLDEAPVHGPVHHHVPLARITRDGDELRFEDLRPRFLPLSQVRDRLRELSTDRPPTGAFTIIVGDGVRTFGDVDQDLVEGVTGDEALQSAVNRLSNAGGGTVYIRAGDYRLEKPVVLSRASRLRVLGDGDASRLRVVGAGGAFLIDGCGSEGEVGIEMLSLVEAPLEDSVIGADAEELPPPGEEVDPLEPDDLARSAAEPSFEETVAATIAGAKGYEGRTMNAVRATLHELRRLQRANPGQPVEDLPEAAPLLASLRALPHGVVTVADSRRVRLARLHVESREPSPEAAGVFFTGTCADVAVIDCRVVAAAGVVAAPYAPYVSRNFLALAPRSGLQVDGLEIAGVKLRPRGDAAFGVHLADGQLRRIAVRGCDVRGFSVGVAVRARMDGFVAAANDIAVIGNRVLGCTGAGIDVVGRAVEVTGNTVANAAPEGLAHAGIRVRGRQLRVRDCDVSVAAASGQITPLHNIAGIIVGGGIDDGGAVGYRGLSLVQDAEVSGCSIRGARAATPAIGVLVGGPEPILDVRVRDCDIADLGDAAVRVWGHGGKVGRVRVADNRIAGVALAAIPARTDVSEALDDLSRPIATQLDRDGVDRADPAALLGALATIARRTAIAPLDAVLRWVSLLTLRGAVLLDHVNGGEVVDNRIDRVGIDQAAHPEARTAAIAAIGGIDVTVRGNRVDNVVGHSAVVPEPPAPGQPSLPSAFVVLGELELADGVPRTDVIDVHLAATSLRKMILDYGAGDDGERQRIGRRIYGAMDALVDDLDRLGGTGAKIAASMVLEADEMRVAQGRDDHTRASNRVRATLSRAAAFTAESDRATEAWEAATQFDLAVVDEKAGAAATRLQDAAEELAEGLPERAGPLDAAMAAVVRAPDNLEAQLAAARELGTLGDWRDAGERLGETPAKQALGAKRTIIRRFTERLESEAERLASETDENNRVILDTLADDKRALLESLRGSNETLARALESDWRSVERSVTAPRKERLLRTIAAIKTYGEGGAAAPASTAEEAERLGEAGDAALVTIVTRHLDGNIARLSVEPEGTKTKSIKVLQSAAGQLRSLVTEDDEAAELASKASAAIRAAAEDTEARSSRLAEARAHLGALRRRAEILVPPRRPEPPPATTPTRGVDKLLAALGALALSLRDLGISLRDQGIERFRAGFTRVQDAARIGTASRAAGARAVERALDEIGRNLRAAARLPFVETLVKELERIAARLGSGRSDEPLSAVVVLLRAALFGLAAGDDEATRLLRVQAFLRESGAVLTPSVLADLNREGDIASMLDGIGAVLERLARGERPVVPDLPEPFYARRLAPADGILAASPVGRLRLADNEVQHVVRGVTLLGTAGHPLVGATRGAAGLTASIAGNRFDGCALGGLDLRPAGDVSLEIDGNEVFASAGVAEPGPEGTGQAVVYVRGAGELVICGNHLHGNGNSTARALLHEIAVDWRGEAVLRGNTVRHVGAGAGGVGLLIAAESIASTLLRRLATAPFLGIEPPPAPPKDRTGRVDRPPVFLPAFPALPIAGPSFRDGAATLAKIGRLIQRTSEVRVAPRLVTEPRRARPSGRAEETAVAYLTREVSSPLLAVLELAKPWTYWKPLPLPPPEQRTFHIESNDISARGPALLLAGARDGDLISTSVVGNGLHSDGGTGAAYLRFADTIVFTGNRCQAPDAINVVVVRALASAVTATGNVVVGREPVSLPRPPLVAPPRPIFEKPTLNLPVGGGSIAVPLDTKKLRGSLEAFSSQAKKAFSNVLLARAAEEEPFLAPLEIKEAAVTGDGPSGAPPPPAAPAPSMAPAPSETAEPTGAGPDMALSRETLASGKTFGSILSIGSTRYSLTPFSGPQEPEIVLKYIEDNDLGSRDIDALIRGTELVTFEDENARQAFIDKVDLTRTSKKLEEVQTRSTVDTAVERADAGRVFTRVATETDTQAGAVASMTQLFTAQGFDVERTTAEVQALLDESDGDAVKALSVLERDVIATDDASLAARKVFESKGLLEKLLVDGIIGGTDVIAEPEIAPEPEPEPEPNAHDHSLVVLGGAAVAAVGNATTAGTVVIGAAETAELNV